MLTRSLAATVILSHIVTGTLLAPRQENAQKNYINGSIADASEVVLQISTKAGQRNDTAPLLYGWMIEDINHSIDGGLYAEMIANRAFQGSTITLGMQDGLPGTSIVGAENPIVPFGPVLTGWQSIGGAQLSLDVLHPLSGALPTALQVTIPKNAAGEVGFLNFGFWGMDVSPQAYNSSFYLLANGPIDAANLTNVNVSLRSNITNDIWITRSVPIANLSSFSYTQFSTEIDNDITAPNSNNTFAITFDAAEVAGSTFYFGLISLFPETFKMRPNGLRKDLGQHIKDLDPKFLRFPGGNNLEGYSIDQRWKWQETIGPLVDRPGRPGTWEYYNTDGFGLLEYLEWTEDMDLERVLAIYAGYSLSINGSEGASYPQNMMDEVLQDALDELEYCMGNSSTRYGALRISHGHIDPFPINFIEIGNEDFFSSTYDYRYPILYEGLKERYPNVTIISTAFNENADYNITIAPGNSWDYHAYDQPSYFLGHFNYFDNWEEENNATGVTVLAGEYSVFSIDTPSGKINFSDPIGEHIFYPELLSAIAESVFLLGLERNPNVVRMSSYAPSFQNFNWYNWTPNLVAFDANPNSTVLSVSYYAQQLLAHYRGTQTLPVTNTAGDFNPLYWVATFDDPSTSIYLKVVNTGNTSVPLRANFDVTYATVNGTILTNADVNSFNFRNNQTAVVPVPFDLPKNGTNIGKSAFDWDVPAFSITVLQFDL